MTKLHFYNLLAHIQPTVQAFWKLNPPVTASIFKISPIKNRFLWSLLSKRLKLSSFKSTPPAVTNSSLKVLSPLVLRTHCVSSLANPRSRLLETSAQFCYSGIWACKTNLSHNRYDISSKTNSHFSWRINLNK